MKRFLSSTFLLLLAIGFFSISSPVLASDPSYGLNDTAKAADLSQYNTPVPELIGNIIGTALSMISVVFFILAIYGGFRMMFARGKDDEFSKGKDILIHAIIGMIVILASYAITQFVFGSVKSGGGNGGGGGAPVDDGTPADKNGKEPGSVALGETCTATADCAGAGLTCTGGVCTSPTGAPSLVAQCLTVEGACVTGAMDPSTNAVDCPTLAINMFSDTACATKKIQLTNQECLADYVSCEINNGTNCQKTVCDQTCFATHMTAGVESFECLNGADLVSGSCPGVQLASESECTSLLASLHPDIRNVSSNASIQINEIKNYCFVSNKTKTCVETQNQVYSDAN
jgi:hypothetical protein